METLRTVWKTGRKEVSDIASSKQMQGFAGCQISVSFSSFSGEKALGVEGRTAKWAGPEAGNHEFVQF